jgi:flavin-dependent dehydrogenase
MAQPVTIIGGGLAGLTLGIGLRQHDVPVTIHEAGQYPRHRVCGEFISGRGQATLARLHLRELMDHAGAVNARTAAFFSATKSTAPRLLPSGAVCLSRFILDAALAKRFRELGGELCERSRRENFGEGIVRATGRRLQIGETAARWFGLKIHARNVILAADLEMHVSPRGYVGLCKINDGEVNVCGLFKKSAAENNESKNPRELLYGLPGSSLRQRLKCAEFVDDSVCAVAGLSLQPQQAATYAETCIGDSVTMIPPITGNGMSMAFESAELAIKPLVAWSRGELFWTQARQRIVKDCDAVFARRLVWAKWLQRLILTPALQNPVITMAAHSPWFWNMAFNNTR